MRQHRVSKLKLSRDLGHRKALLKNMSASLIENEKIETTIAKAKAIRPYVEKLITKARTGSDFNTLRYLRTKLFSETAIRKLVEEIGPKYKDRKGGYLRITRTRNRDGDNSVMARIELVEETIISDDKEIKKTSKSKSEKKGAKIKEDPKTKKEKASKKKKDVSEEKTTEEKNNEAVENNTEQLNEQTKEATETETAEEVNKESEEKKDE